MLEKSGESLDFEESWMHVPTITIDELYERYPEKVTITMACTHYNPFTSTVVYNIIHVRAWGGLFKHVRHGVDFLST